MQKLDKKTEEMAMKNKYIATLTHEIKNFVEAYRAAESPVG